MSPLALPPFAAWRHHEARDGFEVVFIDARESGCTLEGTTTAVEDGEAWSVSYDIVLDPGWATRSVRVSGRSASGGHEISLEADGAGGWRLDGAEAPHLQGCLDVDLESSSLTNAFPVRRLGLAVGDRAEAPAAYVRAGDLRVERLDQRYLRLDDDGARERYDYVAPAFDFAARAGLRRTRSRPRLSGHRDPGGVSAVT